MSNKALDVTDLKIRFKMNGLSFTWIGGESFMVSNGKEVNYLVIGHHTSKILALKAAIEAELKELLKATV